MSERTDLRLPWHADGIFVFNCDSDLVATADTKHEAVAIAIAVNNHNTLVEVLKVFLGADPKLQISLGGNPRYIDAFLYKARALLAEIGEAG